MDIQNTPEKEIVRTIIVGINAKNLPDDETSTMETLDELVLLIETAGAECVGRVVQNRQTPDRATFVGEGKIEEVREMARNLDATMVVFDSELSPSQKRNLENRMDLQVLDRSALILDIFASRARTAEGKLQVELAQYQYLLPRLSGKGIELSRLGGGIGTRGPGESKLETDRRHIRARISRLQSNLEEVRRHREVTRRQRKRTGTPIVSIVGYTNAGKSTLLNALTGANVSARNRLFETLDTTAREFAVTDTQTVILTDTVGFIRKLPTQLIKAFRSTLEELAEADLILHVIDASSDEWKELSETCERIVDDFCGREIPRLCVFNKIELLPEYSDVPRESENVVYVSAKTESGLDKLTARIAEILDKNKHDLSVMLPYNKGELLDILHTHADVEKVEYLEDGIFVKLRCDDIIFARIEVFEIGGD